LFGPVALAELHARPATALVDEFDTGLSNTCLILIRNFSGTVCRSLPCRSGLLVFGVGPDLLSPPHEKRAFSDGKLMSLFITLLHMQTAFN
jgi:hypothetical protein